MSSRAPTEAVLRASVQEAKLDPWPIPSDQVVEGDPRASGTILWKSEDGTRACGVWECTPGAFRWVHADETLCLVAGRVTVTPEGGEPFEIRPGDIVFFKEGTPTEWKVSETVRKAFHLYAAGGLGL
jgi:uncharacterized cupin superfamily protein